MEEEEKSEKIVLLRDNLNGNLVTYDPNITLKEKIFFKNLPMMKE